ncbi:TPA: rRNA maturation RNase YbeY, partial [Candidatus Scatousia excrementigallinarum]|nr:rRNA maturation RNase YbeY [Candidatus Scatousia excrementigallinarum]
EQPEINENCCLQGQVFNTISFDFLYCDSAKTHEINREYRDKDYPADIITFAIFADSDEKFIFDGEINLGEVIIALDKVREEAVKKNVTPEFELSFLISHGIMHLLGFDHQTMEDYNFVIAQQNKALESLGEV